MSWETVKVWETDAWIAQKKKEVRARIQKLALKLTLVTLEAKKFGPRKYRKGLTVFSAPRSGTVRHWHRMALHSLTATRRKIYRLEEELKFL